MYNGNRELVIQYLSGNNDYGHILAIGACVKNRFADDTIRSLLEELEPSDAQLLGVRVGDLATAALHELGIKQYAGNDPGINAMIAEHFSFAL